MLTPTINARVLTIRTTLWHYRHDAGHGSRPTDSEVVTDLLVDLKHYAAVHGIDFDACMRRANEHVAYEAGEAVEA